MTYDEFWDWLQEYEEKLGRGVVMVMHDQLGYLKAEYALPYANEDFADAILTYEMGEEYVIAPVLKADGKTMRLAYRKGIRVPLE